MRSETRWLHPDHLRRLLWRELSLRCLLWRKLRLGRLLWRKLSLRRLWRKLSLRCLLRLRREPLAAPHRLPTRVEAPALRVILILGLPA